MVIRDIGLRFVIWVILDDVPVSFYCSKCPNGLSKPFKLVPYIAVLIFFLTFFYLLDFAFSSIFLTHQHFSRNFYIFA